MPANAVELVNLPGVAVKATISNIVWVGGGLSLPFKTAYFIFFLIQSVEFFEPADFYLTWKLEGGTFLKQCPLLRYS